MHLLCELVLHRINLPVPRAMFLQRLTPLCLISNILAEHICVFRQASIPLKLVNGGVMG